MQANPCLRGGWAKIVVPITFISVVPTICADLFFKTTFRCIVCFGRCTEVAGQYGEGSVEMDAVRCAVHAPVLARMRRFWYALDLLDVVLHV